jgi:hypothetical protein
MSFLAPYHGVRYHLKEYAHGCQAPQNAKELFNHRHASLRNAIERIFGVLKKRFPILRIAQAYHIETQTKIVLAMCTLQNFLHVETGEDWLYAEYDNEQRLQQAANQEDHSAELPEAANHSTNNQHQAGNALRDKIAKQMWEDHSL